MAQSFSATVDAWTRQTEERLDAVYARAFELLGEEMAKTKPEGGNLPFLTGNLSRSLLASKSGMPSTKNGPFSGDNIGLVAATLTARDIAWIGYQASYAARRNFGYIGADSLGRTYNENGDHFVEKAVAMWPNLVSQAIREVRGV